MRINFSFYILVLNMMYVNFRGAFHIPHCILSVIMTFGREGVGFMAKT